MRLFLLMTIVAMAFSSIGFKKYIWFISIGYGFAVAAIGAGLLVAGHAGWYSDAGTILACLLFVLYGLRLGGYLALREWKSASYNDKMKTEVRSGAEVSIVVKLAIWISASLLYACETCPVIFRMANGNKTDSLFVAGIVISFFGLVMESMADFQKNAAKKKDPSRFVDTGLFRLVRCPNYLGEILFWTGVFIGGLTILRSPAQWTAALFGYLGIIYVMFSGARRLEMRQNRIYGEDPGYQDYIKTTPIMIPFIPLYSVEKYKWLVA